jgi:hypothetical protein
MNIDALSQPIFRRWWLLGKALEAAPLDKALKLARAADEFLRGGAHVVARAASALPTAPTPPATQFPALPPANPWPAIAKPVDETASPVEPEAVATDDAREAEPITGSAKLASIEDVVRYLRQRDDTVVRAEAGIFVVNGRFRMSADDLASRANRMRARDQKPAFQLCSIREQPARLEVLPTTS